MKGKLGLQSAVVVLVAVLGFLVGTRTERASNLRREAEGMAGAQTRDGSKSGRMDGGGPGVAGEGGSRQWGSPAARVRNAIRQMEMSPMAMLDFDTMFEVYEGIRDMSPAEVQSALRELEIAEASPQIKMMMQMMLINRWAKVDGKAAVEFASTQTQPQAKTMGMMGGLMGWLKADPDAAYNWYEANRETIGQGMMGGGMDGMFFNALAQRDMPGAFERLKLLDRKGQEAALNSMAGSVAGDPVKQAQFLEGLQGIENEKTRQEAMKNMVRTMAWQDPKEAIAFMESQEWDGDTREEMERAIGQSWSNTDPKAAIEWQMENAEGEAAAKAVGDSFGNWVQSDPEAAAAWLDGQPAEVKTDELYETAANRLRWSEEYGQSMDYALRIEGADQRTKKVREIYQVWAEDDAAQAGQWLEGMDEETQKAILAPDPEDPTP